MPTSAVIDYLVILPWLVTIATRRDTETLLAFLVFALSSLLLASPRQG